MQSIKRGTLRYLLKNDMFLQKIPVMLRVRNTRIIYQENQHAASNIAKYEATDKKQRKQQIGYNIYSRIRKPS